MAEWLSFGLLLECTLLRAAFVTGGGPYACPRTHALSPLSPLLLSWAVALRYEPHPVKEHCANYLSFANTLSLLVLITVVGDA